MSHCRVSCASGYRATRPTRCFKLRRSKRSVLFPSPHSHRQPLSPRKFTVLTSRRLWSTFDGQSEEMTERILSRVMTQTSPSPHPQVRHRGTASWALMKKSLIVCLIEDHKERRCTDEYIVFLFPKQQKVKSIPTGYQKGPISGQG